MGQLRQIKIVEQGGVFISKYINNNTKCKDYLAKKQRVFSA